MHIHQLFINGQSQSLPTAPALVDNAVWFPLQSAAKLVEAELQETPDGTPMLCQGDLCVRLEEDDRRSIDGHPCVALQSLAHSFGLEWNLKATDLYISMTDRKMSGVSMGMRPPNFTLPDLYTGEPVSLNDFIGKKAIFYMWASW
jgi:hypothetical protein